MTDQNRLEKLEAFFKEVAELTFNHEVLSVAADGFDFDEKHDEYAVVYPRDLGKALERVDPEWWRKVGSTLT